MSKKKSLQNGLVYSTNPSVVQAEEAEIYTLEPKQQRLVVRTDSKQRAGKVVTIIEGFVGKEKDLELLGKELKSKCGTGGSVKEGCILIQGEYKNRVHDILSKCNYQVKIK